MNFNNRTGAVVFHEIEGAGSKSYDLAMKMMRRYDSSIRGGSYHGGFVHIQFRDVPLHLIDLYLDRVSYLNYPVNFWVGMDSGSKYELQTPMYDFDFDDAVEKFNFDVWGILKAHNIKGYVYESAHGYHILGATTNSFDFIVEKSIDMNTWGGHRNIAIGNGYWTIRVGSKQGRHKDIKYVGKNTEIAKGEYMRIHDYFNLRLDAMTANYRLTERYLEEMLGEEIAEGIDKILQEKKQAEFVVWLKANGLFVDDKAPF